MCLFSWFKKKKKTPTNENAPHNYQQWLKIFRGYDEVTESFSENIKDGELVDIKSSESLFLTELIAFINKALQNRFDRINNDLQSSLEFGDVGEAEIKIKRFISSLSNIKFYHDFKFLKEDIVKEIDESIDGVVKEYLDKILGVLSDGAVDDNSLFDLYYLARTMIIRGADN